MCFLLKYELYFYKKKSLHLKILKKKFKSINFATYKKWTIFLDSFAEMTHVENNSECVAKIPLLTGCQQI